MIRPSPNAFPLVSFGLPVRNGAPTIAQAIESVLSQTFEDWELVISDNRSTDGTSEICASFAARDERIRHVTPDRDLSIHENFREPSTTREARTSGGTETMTGWSRSTPSAPSRLLRGRRRPFSARPFSSTIATGTRCRCTTQYRSSAVSTRPTREPASAPSCIWFENGGHLGIDPVYSLVRREVAARTGLQGSIRDGDFVYSCEMALLGPFVHVPDVLAHRRLPPVNKLGISRNFLQREQSILCVARSSKSLPARSRVRVGAALIAFATREHAHGIRRRARAIKDRYHARDVR